MQLILYADIVFLINLIADCLVLWLVCKIMNHRIRWVRILLAGMFGAGSLLLFTPYIILCKPIVAMVVYIGILLGSVIIVFGMKIHDIIFAIALSTTFMILLGYLMGYIKRICGMQTLNLFKWILIFAISGLILGGLVNYLLKKIRFQNHIYSVELRHNDLYSLEKMYLDTGNMLCDPLFRKPVIVISVSVLKEYFTLREFELILGYIRSGRIDYTQVEFMNMLRKNGFHEITYESVGNPSGRLLCFTMDEIRIVECNQILKKQPVAIADGQLFMGKSYQGLLQRDCISL